MKNTKKKGIIRGFTLIELLVVVAIIGILAAVGIPIFQGFMATAKINASTENHARAKDMVTAYFAKCSTGTATIALKTNSTTTFTDVACNSSMSSFADYWSKHFNNDGWQNPYSKGSTFAKKANGAGALGEMRFWYSGTSLTINTNVGDEDGKSKSLTASIMKE
jgi:type IV pilus assembly protein PilA